MSFLDDAIAQVPEEHRETARAILAEFPEGAIRQMQAAFLADDYPAFRAVLEPLGFAPYAAPLYGIMDGRRGDVTASLRADETTAV